MYMNPMSNKTPEERRAIAAKGRATAKRRREERDAEKSEVDRLRNEIAQLEARLNDLMGKETLTLAVSKLTGEHLINSETVVKAASPWGEACGVYFLVQNNNIVYVGQSINVHARVANHYSTKSFDSYAYLPCAPEHLDVYESGYIHYFQPRLNGVLDNGAKAAPISYKDLLRKAAGA